MISEYEYHIKQAALNRALGHKCLFIGHLKAIQHYLEHDQHLIPAEMFADINIKGTVEVVVNKPVKPGQFLTVEDIRSR